ncbi:Mannosyl-oligosaccharide glucosidase [Spathaspora sp. JA1]|nr:Mannosyl-oligosaccharide glucosidase [Spathaspora sp. JA1]
MNLLLSFLVSILIQTVQAAQFDIYADSPFPDITHDPTNSDLSTYYGHLNNNSLLWGPYRSSLYFGLRPRLPRSLLSGLMWFSVSDYTSVGNIRHFYQQHDKLNRANWIKFDPRFGGRQVIDDDEFHVTITIDFVKSQDGLSWGVKVSSVPHSGFEDANISFVWYSGLEGETTDIDQRSGYLKLENSPRNVKGYDGSIKLAGISTELGAFTLEITDGPATNKHPQGNQAIDKELDPTKTHHLSLTVPDDNVWKARDIFMTLLQESIQDLSTTRPLEGIPPENVFILRDLQGFEGNVHFIQKIYSGKCQFEILYNNALTPKPEQITRDNLPQLIQSTLEKIDKKFDNKFNLNTPFTTNSYREFAQEIISGLLGGTSYFYGDQLVDRETSLDEQEQGTSLVGTLEGPSELFTLVPSRPFFPRGFLWDEGFHLIPLLNYDSDFVLEIIKSWFNQIDHNGWIAREQIIGPESRSKVPPEFQVQSPEIVNPPTLTLVLIHLLNHVSPFDEVDKPVDIDSNIQDKLGNFILHHPQVLTNYTRQIYPQLKKHLHMFRHTQAGTMDERGSNKEAYRWRGRTESHCLASGLDDYPRAETPDVGELHVDLLSWIGVMTKSLNIMANLLNQTSDVAKYTEIENNILENLNNIHWSKEHQCYCDVTLDEEDEEDVHVCHKGYISLFPFLTKLIDPKDTEKLTHIINLITSEQLWTPFGIRSLSNKDPQYNTGENYWKSPIWININYLILESIQYYHDDLPTDLKEKFAKAYKELRVNVVNNVYNEWKSTGFVWEQYDDITGKHKGAKNFLGWTSLVLVMMNMPESL